MERRRRKEKEKNGNPHPSISIMYICNHVYPIPPIYRLRKASEKGSREGGKEGGKKHNKNKNNKNHRHASPTTFPKIPTVYAGEPEAEL